MTLLLTQYILLSVPTAEGCLLIDLEVGFYIQSNMKIFLKSTHTIISLTTPIEIIQTVLVPCRETKVPDEEEL